MQRFQDILDRFPAIALQIRPIGTLSAGLMLCFLTSACQFLPTSAAPKSAPTPAPTNSSNPQKTSAPSPQSAVQNNTKAAGKSTNPDKPAKPPANASIKKENLSIDLYRLDNQCDKFTTEKISVSPNDPLKDIVGRVMQQVDNGDFSFAGYRVKVNGQEATIDLRIAPDSKRPLKALSNCEQLALYGSIRKTLLNNKSLKIKSVQFSDRGQIIKPE